MDKKRAEVELRRLGAVRDRALEDCRAVVANIDELCTPILQQHPELDPTQHPRLGELRQYYERFAAKYHGAEGDGVLRGLSAILAGIVQHYRSQGLPWDKDPLYIRVSTDFFDRNLGSSIHSRAVVDRWLSSTRKALGY